MKNGPEVMKQLAKFSLINSDRAEFRIHLFKKIFFNWMPTSDQALIANPMFFPVSVTFFLNWKCFENVRWYIQVDWQYWNQLPLSQCIGWIMEHKSSKHQFDQTTLTKGELGQIFRVVATRQEIGFPWVRKTLSSHSLVFLTTDKHMANILSSSDEQVTLARKIRKCR